MTEGNPIKLILMFAWPLLLGNIFQQLYNVVDSTVVGRFVGHGALAAVGSTHNLSMLTFCICMGMTTGAGIILSQCIGAKKYDMYRKTVGTLATMLMVISAIMVVLALIFSRKILVLMSVTDEIIDDALLYFRIIMIGTPFSMAYNICSSILRSNGNSKIPLYMLILSSIVNIVMDLVFVICFGLEISGVAIATVIAQAISAITCSAYIYHNRKAFNLEGTKFKHDIDCAVKIFKTGIPTALQSSMIAIGNMSVQRLIYSYGTMTIAAHSAVIKIDSFAIMVVVTLASSLSVFCGQNAGAGKIDRIKSGLYKTLATSFAYCGVICVITWFFGGKLLLMFLDPKEASEAIIIGTEYLKIVGAAYFMAGIMRSYLNVIQGSGDVNVSMITGLAELAFRIIASYILVKPFGITGLWVAIPVSWGLASLIPVIRYYSGKWKSKILV